MKSNLLCISLLVAGGLAVQCKADYLFTYQDSAGNAIGFSEATLQPSGLESSFLFDKNSVSSFAYEGTAPSTCEGLASLQTACTGLVNSSSLGHSLFPNGSFNAAGVYSGSNGATVDIVQYSGYLFTYQDANGNILAFSEPTLQSNGGADQFLFSTGGVSNFSFSADTTSCGAVGSVNFIGCTVIDGSLAGATIFPAGSFLSTGTFTGSGATVNIVQSAVTPEPRTTLLFSIALLAGGFLYPRQRPRPCPVTEAKR